MLFFILSIACSTSEPSGPPAVPSPGTVVTQTPAAAPAALAIVPGSHEDWCPEHAVAESQCTLCNPSLVAAFKATGDWCPEHGLPESQCRTCNPELKIERPTKQGG